MKLFKRYPVFFHLLIIYILGLIAYANSFFGEFVFDDFNTIILQEKIKNIADISAIWRSTHTRFIPFISYAMNYRLHGYNPLGYHLVNFLIHIINAFLVYFLAKTLQKTPLLSKSGIKNLKLFPLIAALLFTVHPVQTQAVNYISQRSALLAAFFYFLTLILFLKQKTGYYLLSLFTLVLALLSKENSYTLPLTIASFQFFLLRAKRGKAFKKMWRVLPYFIITAVVFSFIYLRGQTNPLVRVSSLNMLYDADYSRYEYLLTQFNVIRTYLRLMIFPIFQNIDYDYPLSKSFFNLPVIFSFLSFVLLISLAVKAYRKNPFITLGISFFFLTLSVESSVIPIKDVIFEHRLYLPSFGIFLAVTSTLLLILNKKILIPVSITVISVLTILTVLRNGVWLSEYSLWQDAAAKSPAKARVRYNLGVAAYGINKIDEARKEFALTVSLDPQYSAAYKNLAAIYESENDFAKALEIYQRGLSVNDGDFSLKAALAAFYAKHQKYPEAETQYRAILKLDPENAAAYNDLGSIYFMQNKEKEAIKAFENAYRLKPDYEKALQNLANVNFHYSHRESAGKYYRLLLNLNPQNPQAVYGLGELNK